jgi:hypothetical protein
LRDHHVVPEASEFREERFLFELPYDARIAPHFAHHVKDVPHAPRESDWKAFDLQVWLGFDSPPVEGSMASTTLKFSAAERPTDTLYFVRQAFPRFFAINRVHDLPKWKRPLYTRPALRLKDLVRRRQSPRVRRTVVEAVRIAPRPEEMDGEWRMDQLRYALERLNRFLLAAATVHGDPELAPVSLQELPPIVCGMGWDLPPAAEQPHHIDFWTYLVNDRIPDRPRKPLTRAEADLAMWLSVESDHPLVASSRLFLSAQQAEYRGRLSHAVVDAGTGVEMLIAAAVRLIGPDRGYSDDALSRALQAPFRNLVEGHFAKLMDYSSDPENASDALGRWWRSGYRLRNAVVHEGLAPREDEAEEAIRSALQLQRDLRDRMQRMGLASKLPQVPENVKKRADQARAEAGELDR